MKTGLDELNKQEMIDTIYEKIANKELSFGCKIIDRTRNEWSNTFYITEAVAWWCTLLVSNEADDHSWYELSKLKSDKTFEERFKIIWHPVIIWDALDYIEDITNPIFFEWVASVGHPSDQAKADYYHYISYLNNKFINIRKVWKNKRLPIEEQSEECIEYVYNLIKD